MLLHLHEWGERAAPPLVCLHGITAHGRRFRRLAEERAALLDPAIQLLPHVGLDLAEDQWRDHSFASPEEAVRNRLDSALTTERELVEQDVREHLVAGRDGRYRYRYCRSAVVSIYGELCTPP